MAKVKITKNKDGQISSIDINSLSKIKQIIGPLGPQGIQGQTGEPGEEGLKGLQGLEGKLGENGLEGQPGVPGPMGEVGLKGDPGNNGSIGPKGEKGQDALSNQTAIEAINENTDHRLSEIDKEKFKHFDSETQKKDVLERGGITFVGGGGGFTIDKVIDIKNDNRLTKTNTAQKGNFKLEETGLVVDDNNNLVMPKTSSTGIKVDIAAPTFGFADIIGDQFSKNTGATKPVLTPYNGVINSWKFSVGDEAFMSFHIPHDYVLGTDLFWHIHWSHIVTFVTGGTITFKITSIYAKGHNQAAFQSSPAVGTFTGTASTTQYQQIISEIQYSTSSPTGLQIDTGLLEPDGVIEMTFEVDANNITVSSGGVPDPFIHFVDIHYQTTNLLGTKSKTPDFYV